jgi:hypothetical protein
LVDQQLVNTLVELCANWEGDVALFRTLINNIALGEGHSIVVDNNILKIRDTLNSTSNVLALLQKQRLMRTWFLVEVHEGVDCLPLISSPGDYPTAPLHGFVERVFNELEIPVRNPQLYTVLQQGSEIPLTSTMDLINKPACIHIIPTHYFPIPKPQ